MENRNIHISTGTIFKAILMVLAVWFLYTIRDVIVLLFISVILVSAMEPAVDYLQRKRIPRSLTVLGIYILLLVIIITAASFLVPPLIRQTEDFSQNFPQYSQKLGDSFGPISDFIQANHINLGAEQIVGQISSGLNSLTQNIFSKTIGVFSGLVSVTVVFAMAFYMSVEENGIKNFIVSVMPIRHQEYVAGLTERIKNKIGKWMLGQLIVMFIIFLLDFVGLSIVGVPYALVLGIFAGLMEIIPYVGPIIAAIPGVILGFIISPTVGFLALLVYLLAHQFEGNVVVPIVMKKAVGLNPIAVILALLIGAKLAGILGAVLSIPIAASISVYVGDAMEHKSGKRPA
jgi:predicted PurR-regulated permease PerM